MAYPPQQGPYGGYQGQPGPYGAPPKKDKAPLIATMIFVVALLAGLGITGFVAPGFFLGDDDGKGGGSASGGASGDSSDGGPGGGADAELRRFAQDLVDAANDQDRAKLGGFTCADARPGVRQATNEIGDTEGAELGDITVDGDTAVIVVDISYEGTSAPFAATVAKDGDAWCWQDFAPGTGGSTGDSGGGDSDDGPASGPGSGSGGADGDAEAAAESFAEEFVDAVNAKDADTANGMYCPNAAKGIVDYAILKNADLAVDSASASNVFLTVKLTGTLDGEPLNRGKITVELKGGDAPCVFTFIVG